MLAWEKGRQIWATMNSVRQIEFYGGKVFIMEWWKMVPTDFLNYACIHRLFQT